MIDALLSMIDLGPDGVRVGASGPFGGSFRETRSALTTAVYHECHAGYRAPQEGALLAKGSTRDRALERELEAALPRSTRTVGVPLLSVDADRGTAVVALPEARTRIGLDQLLTPDPVVGRPVEVRLATGRPAISPGYYYVQGRVEVPAGATVHRRLYVHLTSAEHAPAALAAVLTSLDGSGVPHHAKVLSTPDGYPRRDALVVYLFDETTADLAESGVVAAVEGLRGIGPETSLFAERLRPGVSRARPQGDARPGRGALSFGQHRAAAVAQGLTTHVHTPSRPGGRAEGDALRACLVDALLEAGIHPDRPWDNVPQESPRTGAGRQHA